ncbi:hypothetical protein F5B18DRAFT_469147 [Nemania serpens]|nr:hypothetical protein F5B18DRAFT_469147 [Nemania serpens]
MADTIRGDGLFQAHDALAALVADPHRLDRARSRFDDSPRSYNSQVSGTPTRSPSPDLRSEQERRREEREWQLRGEHRASFPQFQFRAQTTEERRQILQDHADQTHRVPAGTVFSRLAVENVKKLWAEQGIWNEKWNTSDNWTWKHEESLTAELRDKGPVSVFSEQRAEVETNNEEQGQEQASWAARQRERDATRPFNQFIFQVTKKRKRIQKRLTPDQATASGLADINTKAYEEVKNTWINRGIWNVKWGILPGMSWKHEQPLEEMLQEEFGEEFRLPKAPRSPGKELIPQQESPLAVPRTTVANQQASAPLVPFSSLFLPDAIPPPDVSDQQASAFPNPSPPAVASPAEARDDVANGSRSVFDSQHSPIDTPRPEVAQKRLKRKRQLSHGADEELPKPQRRSKRLQEPESDRSNTTAGTPAHAPAAKPSKPPKGQRPKRKKAT